MTILSLKPPSCVRPRLQTMALSCVLVAAGHAWAADLHVPGGSQTVPGGTYDNVIVAPSSQLYNTGVLTVSNSITNAGVFYNDGTLTSLGSFTNNATVVHRGTALTGNIATAGTDSAVIFSPSTNGAYAGVISGDGELQKSGPASFTLTEPQTYTGTTKVMQGRLVLSGNGALPDHTPLLMSTGAELDISGANNDLTVSRLQGSGVSQFYLGNRHLTLDIDAGMLSTYAGVISGTGSVTKTGTGIQTLPGANTYTGNTTITAGTLIVRGSTTASHTTVQASATLGGSGAVGDALVAGNVAAGDSTGGIDTLTVNGALTLQSGARALFDLDTPAHSDRIQVNGDLTLSGTLQVASTGALASGTYRLFDYTGNLAGQFTTISGLPPGYTAQVDMSTPGQVNLQLLAGSVAIPVLGPWGLPLLALLMGAAAGLRRRYLA